MATALELGVTIPILILSTIGNILTLCVLHRPAFAEKSLTIFLRALAVADLIVTWLDPLCMNLLIPGFLTNTAEVPCKVYGWFFALVSIASSWTLVLVTLERLLIVYRPFKVNRLFTKCRAILLVVGLWLVWGVVGTFTYVTKKKWEGRCSLSETLGTIELVAFMCLYCVIPAVIMITCNVIIIVTLRKAKITRRRMSTKTAASTRQQDRLTTMLITISFVFVLLTLPEILLYAIEFFQDTRLPDAPVWICNFLRRLNHAINFLLYCVSGVMFRRELRLFLLSVASKLGYSGGAAPWSSFAMKNEDECDGSGAATPLRRAKEVSSVPETTKSTEA